MTQRDALFVLVGVLATTVVSLLLFVAILVRQQPLGRPNVIIGRQEVPTQRPVQEVVRRLPPELRFIAPVIPIQRGLSDTGRDAAGLLLVLLLTGGSLVLARDHVVRIQARSAGDLAVQARVLGIGAGVLVMLVSAGFLGLVLLLRTLAGTGAASFLFGLQTLFALFALVLLIVGTATLLGFAAACWRLGVWLAGRPAWRRFGERVPPAVATLLVAVLIYFLAQLPVVGRIIVALALAYSLGAYVRALLIRSEAAQTA